MLDSVKQKITQLIAAYESEAAQCKRLRSELEKSESQNNAYRQQIIELEREIDNLKLTKAFMADGTDTVQARKKIDSLIREIDRCITAMEG